MFADDLISIMEGPISEIDKKLIIIFKIIQEFKMNPNTDKTLKSKTLSKIKYLGIWLEKEKNLQKNFEKVKDSFKKNEKNFQPTKTLQGKVTNILDVAAIDKNTIVFLSSEGKLYQSTKKKFHEKLQAIENLPPMKSIASGYFHFMALSNEEKPRVYSWGDNVNKQLGFVSNNNRVQKPTLIEPLKDQNIDQISCIGELGLGHKKSVSKPTQIKLEFPVEDISKIRFASQLTSILTNDGKLYVTGLNTITGFGSDLTEFKQYPQFKNNNTIIKDIDCGYHLFAILTQDNEIWVQGNFGGINYKDNSLVIRKIQTGNNLTNDLSTYNQIKCCDQNLIFFLKSNSYLSQDLEKLLKNGYLSDCNIQDIPVHKILIETRIGKTFDLIKKYLESNCKLNEIQDLLKWIYCDEMIDLKRTNEILNHFGIQNAQKTKLLTNDLKQLLFDEQTSDFKLVVKNEEDDEEEEEEEEELYIHKFILAARSGLFLNMFHNLEENLQKVKDYSGKSLETIELLISFLYTDELPITADTDQEFIKEEFKDIVEYYQLNPTIPMMDIFEKCSKL
ncbi:btk-binding protein-related [Anaeramoeba flamelloides]|uniref:Btk-binding protein-related n=1 Tax=Anaeramoeba flamelloides TaxID=1746091 RepID=A0AAV8A7Y0_9EUKA|nr:btk-binding protein-related [Anaeramoeba flamelloides]